MYDKTITDGSAEVFISFSEVDTQYARALVDMLSRAQLSYFFYPEHNLRPASTRFVEEIARALERAKVVVCIVTPHSVDSRWIYRELAHAVDLRLGIVPIRPTPFKLPPDFDFLIGDVVWRDVDNALDHETYLLERIRLEIERYRAQRVVSDIAAPSAPASKPAGKDASATPYVGPRPFDAQMQDKFFGREHESAKLHDMLQKNRILVLHAPSGAGKSSLLNAKLAPELRRRHVQVFPHEGATGPLRVARFVPEAENHDEAFNGFTYHLMLGIAPDKPLSHSARLAPFLKSLYRPADSRERVIIIDQFEEVFYTQFADRYRERDGFVDALIDTLLDDPSLRIVLSLRKEYLADIEAMLEPVGRAGIPIDKMALNPVDMDGARHAITKPVEKYVRFDEAALSGLIDQLRQVKVKAPDGSCVRRQGQYIEMAHLQIVCLRLWKSLAVGTQVVTVDDVEGAAGDGRRFEEFVADAMNQFYLQTVDAVAAEKGLPRDLVFFGCSKFVSPQGTRVTLPSQHGRVGRLPDEVAISLVDYYLLRRERRGDVYWYELSHDLLSEPVISHRDRDTTVLLFATDLLDRILENAVAENHGNLDGYFTEHRDLLNECHPLASHAGLFDEELELLLRAGIASGVDATAWCLRVGKDSPELRDKVMREAVLNVVVGVRRNAVRAICDAPVPHLFEQVVDLAISDPDTEVRAAASSGLAQVDNPTLYHRIAAELSSVEYGQRALDTLGIIRTRSAGSDAAARFPAFFATLNGARKRAIRARSWVLRAQKARTLLLTVFVLAAGFATVVAAPYKAIPGYLNWGVSQHAPHPMIGMFQGAVAGVFWAGFIALGVMVFHSVFGNAKRHMSAARPLGAVVFGALSGVFASVVISTAILGVFNVDSLKKMGWVSPGVVAPDTLYEAFVATRFGWVNFITGAGLGIGMALMINAVRSAKEWQALLSGQASHIDGLRSLGRMLGDLIAIAWPRAWLLCVAVAAAALLAFFVPDTTTFAAVADSKANPLALFLGLVGDCTTQIVGAFFGVVGTLLGTVVIRHGISIEPSRY